MALRDQPYLPLFIQDFMTDEKLVNCSPAANGVLIRLMCILHKEEVYGKILLKQKFKQNTKQILNFALQLSKNMPYEVSEIEAGLEELFNEDVVQIKGDWLSQKRMVNDGQLSDTRAKAGKEGGKKKAEKEKKFATEFAKAKSIANTEYETEYAIENETDLKDRGMGKDLPVVVKLPIAPQMVQIFKNHFPDYPVDQENDFPACLTIAQKIAKVRGWPEASITNGKQGAVAAQWEKFSIFAAADDWYQTKSIAFIANNFQNFILSYKKNKKQDGPKINSGGVNGVKPTRIGLSGPEDCRL